MGDPSDEVHNLHSVDTVQGEGQQADYPQKLLHTPEFSGLPPHHLKLKMGCPVVALKSLTPYVVDGTRLIVSEIRSKILCAPLIPEADADVVRDSLGMTTSRPLLGPMILMWVRLTHIRRSS